jgi:hypothetical protein
LLNRGSNANRCQDRCHQPASSPQMHLARSDLQVAHIAGYALPDGEVKDSRSRAESLPWIGWQCFEVSVTRTETAAGSEAAAAAALTYCSLDRKGSRVR